MTSEACIPQKRNPYLQLMTRHNALYPQCPIRNVLARIGDKWSMLILHALTLQENPMRFGELQRAIADASPKMLTTSLRNLEEDGIVVRTIYPEVPPRVEYTITPRGKELMGCMKPLIVWADNHMEEILRERMNKVNQK